ASRYAVKATPIYDQDGAGGNMGNPAYTEYFSDFTNGEGLNKDATLGHPSHVLPIPSDQQFNGAGAFQNPSSANSFSDQAQMDITGMPQYSSSLYPMAQGYQTFNGLRNADGTYPFSGQQPIDTAGTIQQPYNPYPTTQEYSSTGGSQFSSNLYPMAQEYHIINGHQNADGTYPYSSQEPMGMSGMPQYSSNSYPMALQYQLQGGSLNAGNAHLLAPEVQPPGAIDQFGHFQGIRDFYSQQLAAASVPIDQTEIVDLAEIESAIKEKHFIAFLYVDEESKQLMFRHPYSDKMFREVDYGKLQMFLAMPEFFSNVYIIPLSTNHFLLHMALMEQVDKVNFSNDPVRHMFDGKQMPPKNTILKHSGNSA
ncbi:hypothetical protein H4R34_004612, partial [Dimargaris verticillata]